MAGRCVCVRAGALVSAPSDGYLMHVSSGSVTLLCLFMALSACNRSLESTRLGPDATDPVRAYAAECDDGVATSCYALGLVYLLDEEAGQGVPTDRRHAQELLSRACSAGVEQACAADQALSEGSQPGPAQAPANMNVVPEAP